MDEKIKKAVDRLKFAAEASERYYEKPLVITYSGGKDSDVCLELAKIAGIQYEVEHNHTTADAPQTVYHIRDKFNSLEQHGIKCTINRPRYKGKPTSIWDLIPQKKMPPTRLIRYCCIVLKEGGGKNRHIVTGVRWAESPNRKKGRGIYEDINRNRNKRIILNNDNDDKRKWFERCELQAKTVCNPIIDWTDVDVLDFLQDQKVKVNPLYCMGYKRVGCVGCPMAGKMRYQEFRDFPQYKANYIKSFARMLDARKEAGLENKTSWESGEDVFRWWLEEDWRQITMDDLLDGGRR